jgi:YesN/AraC family two-component response regulator
VKYFSQIFKKRVGMTPSEFRKSKGIKEWKEVLA